MRECRLHHNSHLPRLCGNFSPSQDCRLQGELSTACLDFKPYDIWFHSWQLLFQNLFGFSENMACGWFTRVCFMKKSKMETRTSLSWTKYSKLLKKRRSQMEANSKHLSSGSPQSFAFSGIKTQRTNKLRRQRGKRKSACTTWYSSLVKLAWYNLPAPITTPKCTAQANTSFRRRTDRQLVDSIQLWAMFLIASDTFTEPLKLYI